MIPYLTDFWNAITGATEFGVAWFQDVGNAVAGALGNILLAPLREMMGFFLGFAWLFKVLLDLINILLAPFYFISDFLVAVINAIGATYSTTSISAFNNLAPTIAFFDTIPGFTAFLTVLSAAIWFYALMPLIKATKH